MRADRAVRIQQLEQELQEQQIIDERLAASAVGKDPGTAAQNAQGNISPFNNPEDGGLHQQALARLVGDRIATLVVSAEASLAHFCPCSMWPVGHMHACPLAADQQQ